jgi:hypothetical protein
MVFIDCENEHFERKKKKKNEMIEIPAHEKMVKKNDFGTNGTEKH